MMFIAAIVALESFALVNDDDPPSPPALPANRTFRFQITLQTKLIHICSLLRRAFSISLEETVNSTANQLPPQVKEAGATRVGSDCCEKSLRKKRLFQAAV